jgi:uncharacterized RDD family membrane protein YckC
LDRVDIDRVIARSNIDQIIARSSSGVFTGIFVTFRNRIAKWDQQCQRFGRLACCRKRLLPPRPGENVALSKSEWPDSQRDFGLAIQDRYSGSLTRFLAGFTDYILLATLFAIFASLTSIIAEKIAGDDDFWDDQFLDWFVPLIFLIFVLAYVLFSWLIVGRTIGMAMLGLLVVSSTGHRIGFCQAIVRAVLQPLNTLFFGYVLGLIRRDGRQWNDLITGTGFVYSWDARLASLREEDDLLNVSVHFGSNDIESPHDECTAEIPEKSK